MSRTLGCTVDLWHYTPNETIVKSEQNILLFKDMRVGFLPVVSIIVTPENSTTEAVAADHHKASYSDKIFISIIFFQKDNDINITR